MFLQSDFEIMEKGRNVGRWTWGKNKTNSLLAAAI